MQCNTIQYLTTCYQKPMCSQLRPAHDIKMRINKQLIIKPRKTGEKKEIKKHEVCEVSQIGGVSSIWLEVCNL